MSRNVSFLFRQSFSNSSQFDSHLKSQNFGSFYTVSLLASIVVAVLSPVAVVGNALVLAAICKNPSLRTPSYILLAGLAFTDFVTGLITQPVYVANEVIHLKDPTLKVLYSSRSTNKVMEAITNSCAVFFSSTSVLIITLMSIERWLHMTRRSLVTVRRVCIIIAVMLVLPLPLAVYRVLFVTMEIYVLALEMYFVSLLLVCLLIISVAYFKVFRIIRRHQQQIQANGFSHSTGQPSIDFAKYKKSVLSILCVLVVFYIGYLPMFITLMVHVFSNRRPATIMQILSISIVLTFLSSSLNPLVYLWRMKDIRNEVMQLLKRLPCTN